jgi:hypothetical protein
MYVKPEAILKHLKLAMPIAITIEDPGTRQPIVVSYENLHSLLVVDLQHIQLERQVVTNLYAEMARLERACQFEAARSEGRYRTWRSAMAKACAVETPEKKTAAGKKAAKQGPTQAEIETYYRSHDDYDRMHSEGDRYKALAGFFGDLKWAFKMKSEMIVEQGKALGGYEVIARNEEPAGEQARLASYENIAAEAASIAASSGSSEGLADLLSSTPEDDTEKLPKAPRALG